MLWDIESPDVSSRACVQAAGSQLVQLTQPPQPENWAAPPQNLAAWDVPGRYPQDQALQARARLGMKVAILGANCRSVEALCESPPPPSFQFLPAPPLRRVVGAFQLLDQMLDVIDACRVGQVQLHARVARPVCCV